MLNCNVTAVFMGNHTQRRTLYGKGRTLYMLYSFSAKFSKKSLSVKKQSSQLTFILNVFFIMFF